MELRLFRYWVLTPPCDGEVHTMLGPLNMTGINQSSGWTTCDLSQGYQRYEQVSVPNQVSTISFYVV